MINFTIFDKIAVAISIFMIAMLFTMSFKLSGLILKDFEFANFFQIWLFFSWYYLVNMLIRVGYIMKKREARKETTPTIVKKDVLVIVD